MTDDIDQAVRLAAFRFLDEHGRASDNVFERTLLARGFEFRGTRVRLIGPQGIFKPAILVDRALSLTTIAAKSGQQRPYDDGFSDDDRVIYKYRGTDPRHHENQWVRNAMRTSSPLIYFHGIIPGRYLAIWPGYVVADRPDRLEFELVVDGVPRSLSSNDLAASPPPERRYGVVTTRQRLHQQSFRERVLRAYRSLCAVCRLRHEELLDAAHIIPDSDPEGEPVVSNGISLCKLHHAAFDRNLFGVRPDLRIIVPARLLDERDGPMLLHGLQKIHETALRVPRSADERPNIRALERRFGEFELANR